MPGDDYVVDIETVGSNWSDLDDKTQKALEKRGRNDAEREGVSQRLGLWPGTGRVIVIGMLNVTKGVGGVFVEGESKGWHEGGADGFKRFDGTEPEMLAAFWEFVRDARPRRIITYNGRMFDGPYLMIRSALAGIAPTMNLAGYRYSITPHCDLQEILTFQGASRDIFSLDYWCRRFGITSPKDDGIDGSQVQAAYDDGRIEEIASYCIRDIVATGELYKRLEDTLIPLFEKKRSY